MDVQDAFPSSPPSRLVHIITQLLELELELKLSRPENQTEYFRWAVDNHRIQLATLRRQFNNIRLRLNEHSVEDLLDELNSQKEILGRVNASLSAGIIRGIARSALQLKVAEIESMIALKGVVDQLPDFDELRTMPEVWEEILESH